MFSKKFIQRTTEYTTFEKSVPAPYFRKRFFLANLPKSAQITVCGLGFYELYLNGENITKGRFAPYISNPDDVLYYDRYEVAKKLHAGENVIALVLGNGFLNNPGGYVMGFDKASYRDAPKVALSFEADGRLVFEADESFKTAPSPVLFDDYRMGEVYDARKEIDRWNQIGFDDSSWQPALSAVCPKGEARLAAVEPILMLAEYPPEEILESGNGYIYRFPYNIAGVCRLRVAASAGQKITLVYGEYCKDGKLETLNICFDESCFKRFHRDEYICKEGTQEYTPQFTFHGFQYVYVEGITKEQATRDLLTALFLHSDLKSAGEFVCSDETVNRIQENTRRSTLSNFYYFPMDCPQREKNGWTGDAALSAEQMMLNFAAENSLREWLFNICTAQKESGELPGIVPTSGWGFEWGNGPAWDTAIVQLPYYIYRYTGERAVLEENFPAIYRYFEYFQTKADEDGLYAYGLGDWSQPAHNVGLYDTDVHITDTLTLLDFCNKAERIAAVLCKKKEQKEFSVMRKKIKSDFRKAFVEGGKIKNKFATQTAVAMAIGYGAIEKEELPFAKEQLLALIHAKDDHFDTGVLGVRTLFDVLSDLGESDLALKLITQTSFPAYGYHIERGATTLWECFYELKEDKLEVKAGWNINSLNHHFWGSVSGWFFRKIGGIELNPDLISPKTVVIDPVFPKGIDWARASRRVSEGDIKVEWKRVNGKIDLKVNAPQDYRVIRKDIAQ